MSDTTAVHPKFHHFNLKTTRLQEMIDWYGAVVGAEVVFQSDASVSPCLHVACALDDLRDSRNPRVEACLMLARVRRGAFRGPAVRHQPMQAHRGSRSMSSGEEAARLAQPAWMVERVQGNEEVA